MKTLDAISKEIYGKNYNQLPDDGAEQDHIQGLFSKQFSKRDDYIEKKISHNNYFETGGSDD